MNFCPATYLRDPYIAATTPAPAVNWADTQSARGWLLGTTGQRWWRDVGYTNNGLEVSYEPSYGDVIVDQLLDAARLFKQSIRVTLKTELAEGTLENMALAFWSSQIQSLYSLTRQVQSQQLQFFSCLVLQHLQVLVTPTLQDSDWQQDHLEISR
jgi:hypothetical protein